MKIDWLMLDGSARILLSGHTSENKFFASDRWDIALVDYRYFEIRTKSDPKVLAIIPFERSVYCYPAESQVIEDLSSLPEEEETEDSPLLDVVPRRGPGRPRNDGSTFKGTAAARS